MATVVSADHFFMQGGEYKFDFRKLSEAHGACLTKFVGLVQNSGTKKVTILRGVPGAGKSTYISQHPELDVVVDNTCITATEVAPYAALALAFGKELEIVNLKVDPEVAAARCIHGVPAAAVKRMAANMDKEQKNFPPWWPVTDVGN